ncbi:hypothetical protein EZS27_026726, partial [termite gut metagenome]
SLLFRPFFHFFRNYILKAGFFGRKTRTYICYVDWYV